MVEKISKKPVFRNIQQHLSKLMNLGIEKAFNIKDFNSIVSWTSTGSSDLCSPSIIKLYNMNCKKEEWKKYSSTKEVAQELIKHIPKDELIREIKITQQLTETNITQKGNQTKESKQQDGELKVEGKVVDKQTKETKQEGVGKEEKDNKKAKKGKEKTTTQGGPPENYFIDFILNEEFVLDLSNKVLSEGISIENNYKGRKALVDFSSPNIAKEMHVGHLRSTILGESICRVLEFLEVDVMRINHVGDWGTQFGMLIANLEEEHPDYMTNKPQIKELEQFYVQSKKKFDDKEKPEFKKKAYENTVKLQTGEENCREAWKFICEASRNEYQKIYKKLNITITECGESFYDPLCRKLIPELEKAGKVVLDQGAKIMKLDNMKVPMMVVKSDGGFTYDTTDIAAVTYRMKDLQRDWIIYVIGNEQSDHVKAIEQAAKQLGLHEPGKTRIDHMAFGLMLNEDGKKISTREGGLCKLSELLDMARDSARKEIIKRMTETEYKFEESEIEVSSEKIGYSALKYFDMRQTRESSYKFSYKLILDPKGNTAVYLFYNYVRIKSIQNKLELSEEDISALIAKEKMLITHEKERALLVSLIKFNDVIDEVVAGLALNKLADYLYIVCVKFSEFFEECRIKDSEQWKSRVLIVEYTKRMLGLGFNLLGLTPVDRI